MSNCMTLSSGICRGCRNSAGGVKTLYVADINYVDWASMAVGTNGEVTELPLLTYGAWYELQPSQYSANWNEEINVSIENGTKFYAQTVNGVFGKNDQLLRNAIDDMANGELVLIVKDNNNTMWLLGSEGNGVNITGGNSESGTALGDRNGWSVNFTCNAPTPATTVEPAQGSDLETALAAATC